MWDVDETGAAHAQQYLYQTFTLPNGDAHETGVVTALADEQVNNVLEACYNHKILPLMLLLNHAEGHFYGVQYGQQFLDWNALPGPGMRTRLDKVHQLVVSRCLTRVTMMRSH